MFQINCLDHFETGPVTFKQQEKAHSLHHLKIDFNKSYLKYHCHQLQQGRRQWHPTPVLLPGKSHGWRSLVGCSPWGSQESDTTERLHFHFSLSCIGGGNGNPLQCSCLENPRDWGAWWAAVYGVAQSRTRLKRLSSSSSSFSKSFSFVSGFRFSMHFHVNSSLLIFLNNSELILL